MRIWDIEPRKLCRQHLLGEHRELHAIWTILTENKKGYANHPETLRWRGKLSALYERHEVQIAEMNKRGYTHKSPLSHVLATGAKIQNEYVDTPKQQIRILQNKECSCFVEMFAM